MNHFKNSMSAKFLIIAILLAGFLMMPVPSPVSGRGAHAVLTGDHVPGSMEYDMPGSVEYDMPGSMIYDMPGSVEYDISGSQEQQESVSNGSYEPGGSGRNAYLADRQTQKKLPVGVFSAGNIAQKLPDGWEEMTFRGLDPTEYRLAEVDGRMVVRAHSSRSSSGLIRRKSIDLSEYPVIEWSWKVENILEKGDVYSKDGDDYPARIYVIFDYDLNNLGWGTRNMIRLLRRFYGEVPARAINYIYANHAETGTVVANPYTDLVKMIAVDSGEGHTGQWRTYRRNIYEDYLSIYGEEPPPVAGLAIMTDSDDTKASATAYFGDICFLRE